MIWLNVLMIYIMIALLAWLTRVLARDIQKAVDPNDSWMAIHSQIHSKLITGAGKHTDELFARADARLITLERGFGDLDKTVSHFQNLFQKRIDDLEAAYAADPRRLELKAKEEAAEQAPRGLMTFSQRKRAAEAALRKKPKA